jgi:hypothetical protein
MLKTINEMEKHIEWADKLFDMIQFEVDELKLITKITKDDIKKWKKWARKEQFIYDEGKKTEILL